jgi:hypothetical protein
MTTIRTYTNPENPIPPGYTLRNAMLYKVRRIEQDDGTVDIDHDPVCPLPLFASSVSIDCGSHGVLSLAARLFNGAPAQAQIELDAVRRRDADALTALLHSLSVFFSNNRSYERVYEYLDALITHYVRSGVETQHTPA